MLHIDILLMLCTCISAHWHMYVSACMLQSLIDVPS